MQNIESTDSNLFEVTGSSPPTQPSTLAPWLTTADVQRILQLGDPRSARSVMRDLGAVRIGGQYRLPPDLLDSLRSNPVPPAPTNPATTPVRRGPSRPRRNNHAPVTTSLPADWWKAACHG